MHYLFRHKTFKPFFSTQFLGAFNDNIFKNALAIFITYQAINEVEAGKISGLAGALFIAPYIFFSMTAGQLSDKYEKSNFIKQTKLAELLIMILGALGFWLENINFLLLILFLMGTQSTFFGPAKYSILPQVFKEDDSLVAATSYVEMGTFLAILTGTIAGGFLIGLGKGYVCLFVILFAFLGWRSSQKIPKVPIANPKAKISFNPFKQISSLFAVTFQNKSIFCSIFLISWFWFFGAVYLQQIAVFVRYMVNADKAFVTVFLSSFTLSLSLGSVVCNVLSNKKIELALIPIGALGMSFFSYDLSLISYPIFQGSTPITLSNLASNPGFLTFCRAVFDFFSIGFFGSFYIVPLYALMQRRSDTSNCSQVIASNNIINSFFMVASSAYTIYFYKSGYNTAQLLASIGFLNILILAIFLLYMPELWHRFVIFIQSKFFVSYDTRNFRATLNSQTALVVGKKESTWDIMILSYFFNKPVKIFSNISNKPWLEKTIRKLTCYTISKNHNNYFNDNKIISHLNKKEIIYMSQSSFNELTTEKSKTIITHCKNKKIPIFLFSKNNIKRDLSNSLFHKFKVLKKDSLKISLESIPL